MQATSPDTIAEPEPPLDASSPAARETLAELVRLHQRPVRMYLSRLVQEPQAADDLAQEVFLTAFRNLAQFKRESNFGGWLLGIARNKAMSYLRDKCRRRDHEQRRSETLIASWQTDQAAASAVDLEEELRLERQLHACLDRLAPQARQIVDAHYFRSETAESIAAALGKRGASVRMLLMRIRQALGDCIRRKQSGGGTES